MSGNEPMGLCAVCDILHKREAKLEAQADGTVRCPACAKVWDSAEHYSHWLGENVPKLEAEAEAAKRREMTEAEEGAEDRKHRHDFEERADERRYDVARAEKEGTWQRASAWGPTGPPKD